MDEDEPRRPIRRVVGADLGTLSMQDLHEYIDELEAEIARVRGEIGRKKAAMGGAEALFGGKGS